MDQNRPQDYVEYPRNSVVDPRQYYGPPDFRIGALNEAWAMLQADMTTWVLGGFLLGVIAYAVYLPAQFYATARYLSDKHSMAAPDVLTLNVLSSIASSIVVGVLTAGYYRVALQRMRLSYEGIGGIFKVDGQGAKLAVWSFIAGLPGIVAGNIYSFMAPTPDMNVKNPDFAAIFVPLFWFSGVMLVVSFLLFPFFLTPLIIVDQKLGIKDAAVKSWNAVIPKYFRALGFYVVAGLVAASGVLACGVGLLFTLPLLSLMIAIAYRDHFIPPLSRPAPAPPVVPYEQTTGNYP